MSIKNAVMFLQSVNENDALKGRLAKNPTVSGWLKVAAENGFEITPNEFRSLSERLFDKELEGDACVTAFLADQELDEAALDSASGGARSGSPTISMSTNMSSRLGMVGIGGSGDPFDSDSGPSWSNDPGSMNPGSEVMQ